MASGDHYFSSTPGSESNLRPFTARLAGQTYELVTASGIFSPERIDTGTRVLLDHVPPAPPGGQLLDIGCGWGPLALTLALESPHSTVWAVDVNTRALDVVRRNAEKLGLSNVNPVTPEDVPDDLLFTTIWSNPPIRVGKTELHAILTKWLPRLEPGSDAWLVVQRNLGSDSLHRWIEATIPELTTTRAGISKGFRVLRAHRPE